MLYKIPIERIMYCTFVNKMENLGYKTGKIIVKERIELRLNQDQLGEKIGELTGRTVKRQTISNWEKGLTTPDLKQLRALANIFNCDICYLLGDTTFKRVESMKINEITGLSPTACDALITAARNEDPINDIISQLIEDETIFSHIAACATTEYGNVSAILDVTDVFSPSGKRGMILTPQLLKQADIMEIYNSLCKFIDDIRKKNGLKTSKDL